MFEQLNLTDAQKNQLQSLRKEKKSKLDALEKNESMTMKEYKIQKDNIQKEYKAKMESVLTAEQKNMLAAEKQKKSGDAEEKMQTRIEKMRTDLSLSDEQYNKVKSLYAEMFSQIKVVRENESLSMEQKKEQIKNLHKETKSKLKGILNADQIKKLQESKSEGGQGKKMKNTSELIA